MITIRQRNALCAYNKCHDNCARKQQDELLSAIRGSALWKSLQTPMSALIDQLRGAVKS